MNYSTTDTYKMKREIMNYAKKFSGRLSAAEAKFNADMLYGMVASESCLLTQISQRLQEDIKKHYTVDRLSDHLSKGIPKESQEDYLRIVRSMTPSEPVCLVVALFSFFISNFSSFFSISLSITLLTCSKSIYLSIS